MVTRYHRNVIAIETFKRSGAQARSGRIGPHQHRGPAIWAGMNVNLVGREAKELLRS
jgi:hypothetical protein